MRIAFYAPMKPPNHPTPSGDRRMARMLIAALRKAGHRVELASRFRSYHGNGDPAGQRRLKALGNRLADRLVGKYQGLPASRRPGAWFTYHLYHKAPDWLGPAVSGALGIPYVLAEASHAPKQENGPWAIGYAASEKAIRGANLVFGLNPADRECVKPLLGGGGRIVALKPFIDAAPYLAAAAGRTRHRRRIAGRFGLEDGVPWLLAVAMMRQGDKLESYRLLGRALGGLLDRPWRLLVAGAGPARGQVEAALEGLGGRVSRLDATAGDLPALYAASDIFVWPAVNEAFGMAFIEAQAAGLAVVAGNAGGVPAVVGDGESGILAAVGDAQAFASAVARLLDDGALRERMGRAAQKRVRTEHDLGPAARLIGETLKGLAKGPGT